MRKRKTGKANHHSFLWWLFIGCWFAPLKWIISAVKRLFNNVNAPAPQTVNSQELLKLQRIVMKDSPDKLICSEAQLKDIAFQSAENSIRIVHDCSKILQETTNPEVFFDRFRLFSEHTFNLSLLEPYVSFDGASPTEAYLLIIKGKQEAIKEFLIRYLYKVDTKAESLKTQKGKLNQYQKFYDSLKPYFEEMDAENIDYIETKYKAYSRLLNK